MKIFCDFDGTISHNDLLDIIIILNKNHRYKDINVNPPINPNSSIIIANINLVN